MLSVAIPENSSRAIEFQSGDIVDGRYRILRLLADGGMGKVFLAQHVLIKRLVAIKLLHPELADDRGMVGRFLNEASAAGTLGHPHIVESTDMGFTRDHIPYIVFEYLEGCSLLEEIQRVGKLPIRRALLITRQIASALEAAHNAQIAHLDLKSDNVFLTTRGDLPDHAKLLDFGISRFMAVDVETTHPGLLMGTPEFMAPEQIVDPHGADCRSDIYALGVVLYEMLAGRCPFVDENLRWVLHQVVHAAPPPLGRPVPLAVERLLFNGLLVKNRDERIEMTEVIAVLDLLIGGLRPAGTDPLLHFDEPDGEPASAIPPDAPIESWFDDEAQELDPPPWEVDVET